MKDNIENTANEALKLLIENAASAKDFILAETPEVIQQLLAWKMADAIIGIVYTSIALFAIAYSYKKLIPKYKRAREIQDDDLDFLCFGHRLALLGSSVLFFIFTGCGICRIVKIWVAPKVYLIEYAAELVK